MKKFSKLALKFLVGFVLLGVLICAACSAVGYSQYKKSIQKRYNDSAYQVAEVALSYVDIADIESYVDYAIGFREGKVTQEELDAVIATDHYQKTLDKLATLREKMGANDIFFVYTDMDVLHSFTGDFSIWKPMSYLLNCNPVEEKNYLLGHMGPFNFKYLEEATKVLTEGVRADNYFISKSEFGYNTSAMLPVKNADGVVIATIGVETPMATIQSDLNNYLTYSIALTAAVVVLFLAVYMVYLYFRVIAPINTVSAEMSNFVENETAVSEVLPKIKTGDEIQNLANNTLKMQKDIKTYIQNLTAVTAEKERIGAELNVATQIQASMLPSIFPAFPEREEFDIYATMNPAKEVGGDFYDFFMLDDTHVAIVMADVSGKGVPAALFMVIAKTLIKDHSFPTADLGEVFSNVNALLCESNSGGLFVTAFEGVLDLTTGEFRYVNAGHEMPFIYKASEGYVPQKIKAGFVLAGMEGLQYKGGSLMLEPGDRVFQYTDGVTEATNADNQLYGMERLERVLNANTDKNCYDLLPAVKADIDAFVGRAPQFDDITMLCLEYKKKIN